MKDYDRKKESSYRKYWNVNYLYGWTMSQKLSVDKFDWIEDTQFNENFIKNYSEKCDEGFLNEAAFNILKNYMNFMMIYHFYQKK